MTRIFQYLARNSLFDDAPQIHHSDSITDITNDRDIVRYKQVGQIQLSFEFVQQFDDLGLDGDIQRRHRLVANNEARFHDQRAGDTDTLSLTSGKLMRIAIEHIRVQPDTPQHLHDIVPSFIAFRELMNTQWS